MKRLNPYRVQEQTFWQSPDLPKCKSRSQDPESNRGARQMTATSCEAAGTEFGLLLTSHYLLKPPKI